MINIFLKISFKQKNYSVYLHCLSVYNTLNVLKNLTFFIKSFSKYS